MRAVLHMLSNENVSPYESSSANHCQTAKNRIASKIGGSFLSISDLTIMGVHAAPRIKRSAFYIKIGNPSKMANLDPIIFHTFIVLL